MTQFLESILGGLAALLDPQELGVAAADILANLLIGAVTFLVYYLVWRLLDRGWDRPFVIGDLIDVGAEYGRVDRITLRSTRVVTPDGRMLAVPNTKIINETVASYTNFRHLRIDIPVSVAVDSDLDRVREILLGVVRDDPAYMKKPDPVAVVTATNDYNVAMELWAWLENERHHVLERVRLREAAYKALNRAGIELPFETFNVRPLEPKAAA